MFDYLLRTVIRYGSITLIEANGKRHDFGDGSGKKVVVRLADRRAGYELALNPYLKLGEAYMDGRLLLDQGSIFDFLDVLMGNVGTQYPSRLTKLFAGARRMKRRIDQYNPAGRARRNVAHHYDLDGGLYDLFLDTDKQYSCAYFETPDATLEEAQAAKKRHIAAKLKIAPGQRVLDIGSGWGGLGLYLADLADIEVVGVTLSEEQLKIARARAEDRSVADRVDFRLQDYRDLDEPFDRIVSVGMFEHVGVGHYGTYFDAIDRLLAPQGIALVHTIGRLDPPGATNPWIAKYIFPGGYIPALSEIVPHLERTQLLATDVEVLRLHYAHTLHHWRERFLANWEKAAALYDERFCRMWEFYLAASECSFLHDGMVVFQVQMAKRIDSLPITRDYVVDWERDRIDPGRERSARHSSPS